MPHTASQALCLPTDWIRTTKRWRWQPHRVVFPLAQFPTALSWRKPSELMAQLRETGETPPLTPILPFPLPLRGTMLLSRAHWQGSQRCILVTSNSHQRLEHNFEVTCNGRSGTGKQYLHQSCHGAMRGYGTAACRRWHRVCSRWFAMPLQSQGPNSEDNYTTARFKALWSH